MAFIDRARKAAVDMADQTLHAVAETAERADGALHDPAMSERARSAMARAKRGASTVVERIDPAILADVVIKATALQERANAALKAKGSPYRIAEIAIGAAIAPNVSFTIQRLDNLDSELPEASSVAIEATEPSNEIVVALDGTHAIDPDLPDPSDA